MRLLLDTNVLLRSVAEPLSGRVSPAFEVVRHALGGSHELIATPCQAAEFEDVIGRPRIAAIFRPRPENVQELRERLRSIALGYPDVRGRAHTADPKDDPLVAAAILYRADALCTWDSHFHAPPVRQALAPVGCEVLRDDELLARLEDG